MEEKINNLIMSPLVLFVKIRLFVEKHPLWSFLIFILILSYFAPVPYLHDFVREIVRSMWEFLGIGVKKIS